MEIASLEVDPHSPAEDNRPTSDAHPWDGPDSVLANSIRRVTVALARSRQDTVAAFSNYI